LGDAQAGIIRDQDPCARFVETIATLLAEHRIHLPGVIVEMPQKMQAHGVGCC